MRPPRRLTAEEIAIWREVARTVVAREEAALPEMILPLEPPRAIPVPSKPEQPRRVATAASYTPALSTPRPHGLAPLERRYRKRVEAGRIGIEAVLDLHGLTQAEAHGALIHFLLQAQRREARLVLVVTGKGERYGQLAPERAAGILRRLVPHWLRDRALGGVVLGFENAGRGHGGEGALYVRLRRPGGA